MQPDTNEIIYKHRVSTLPNKCAYCHRSYVSVNRLELHLPKCRQRRNVPEVTNVAGTDATTKSKSSKLPTRRLMCEYCGYQTRISCNLLVHRRSHTGEKPYCCEQCGKCFTARYQLDTHRTTHDDARCRRNEFKCDICGVGFLSSRSLYHHKPLHAARKQYACSLCGKSYAQSAGFAQHKRWHRAQNECATAKLQLKTLEEIINPMDATI